MVRAWSWVLVPLVCLGIAAQPASAQAAPAACLVSPGRGIGAIRLGMTREEVVRVWGQPDSVEPDDGGGEVLAFELLRLGAIGLSSEGLVEFVAVGGDRCLRTVEGLTIGDPRSKVRALYGAPSDVAVERNSDDLIGARARPRVGSAARDFYIDMYAAQGLAVVTGQTVHVNGYASDGKPILVTIEHEPLVDIFIVMGPSERSAMSASR